MNSSQRLVLIPLVLLVLFKSSVSRTVVEQTWPLKLYADTYCDLPVKVFRSSLSSLGWAMRVHAPLSPVL